WLLRSWAWPSLQPPRRFSATCLPCAAGALPAGDQPRLQLAEQSVKLQLLAARQRVEQRDDPVFVAGGHLGEAAPPARRQLEPDRAAVVGDRLASNPAFGLELVGEPGDVATGHHQALRQFAHPEP